MRNTGNEARWATSMFRSPVSSQKAYRSLRMLEIAARILAVLPVTTLDRRMQVKARSAKWATWEVGTANCRVNEVALRTKWAIRPAKTPAADLKTPENSKNELLRAVAACKNLRLRSWWIQRRAHFGLRKRRAGQVRRVLRLLRLHRHPLVRVRLLRRKHGVHRWPSSSRSSMHWEGGLPDRPVFRSEESFHKPRVWPAQRKVSGERCK